MTIGELPEEISKDYNNYGNCTTDAVSFFWVCILKGYFFGYDNYSSTVNFTAPAFAVQPAIFDTGTSFIQVPKFFLIHLGQVYLNELIDNKDCILSSDTNGLTYYSCSSSSSYSSLPDLNFMFGEWFFKMQASELFQKDTEDFVRFMLMSSTSGRDQWIIGELLLSKFHLVFNRDDQVIGFYGTEDLYRYGSKLPSKLKGFFIFLIALGALVVTGLIVYGIWRFVKYRKAQITVYDPSMYRNIK